MNTSKRQALRPEHRHYDTIDYLFRQSISQADEYLFDAKLFDKELRRLWETYEVPYEVSADTLQ
jgi:hypothetical protein